VRRVDTDETVVVLLPKKGRHGSSQESVLTVVDTERIPADCCRHTGNKGRERMSRDIINYPDHYKTGGIETIDYIKAKMTPEQFEGYLAGNVIKYISRYRHKNRTEDLKKARVYLNW